MRKSKPQQITYQQVNGYTIQEMIAGDFGQRVHKELRVEIVLPAGTINYIVLNERKEVLITNDIWAAIDRYNLLA